MAELRPALLDFLRAQDPSSALPPLAAALGEVDLAQARLQARDEPASAEAVARLLGAMALAGASASELVDAAKAAASRAPRDESGNDVALWAGAVVWNATGQSQAAEPYFRRVRRSDPADPRVLDFYRELFGDPASATQLNQVLVQAWRASKDPEQRFELAREVAEIAEQRLGSPDRAIEMWRAVIRESGPDPRAIEALTRLYREGKKWTALVDLLKDQLERVADAPETTSERIAILLEIVGLYRDRLKLSTMALATLQRILEIDPQHEASLEALAETYAQAERWNDLLGVHARRIEAARQAGETEREVDLLRRVARIWMERLGNPQRALEPLRQVLEIAPRDEPARAMLAEIHEQRRDFRALIALRREELDAVEGEDALRLRIDLARLAEDRLGDRREAIVAWNEVLAHHGDVDIALAALARLYEREGRWASAAEVLHRKLASCTAEQALPLLNHLGGLYSDRLDDREDAVRVWSELLRLSPGHDKAIRRLRDAYVSAKQWDDLTALYASQHRLHDVVEVLQSAADRLGNVQERVDLYRRVAALCQEQLGQPERALKALERTLTLQPDNLEVARELLPIYREQSNWARLMSIYEVLLRAAATDDDRLETIASMQEVAEHKLASPALTLHWAAAAYRIRPTDPALRDRLESSAERADGWDELMGIYEERAAQPEVAPEERLDLLDKLAHIARDRISKPDDAQRYFRRIIAADPANLPAMRSLEEIYSSTQRWEDLSDVLRKRLAITEDAPARLAILRDLARILEEHLGDLAGAVEAHAAVLALRPEDAAALESQARIHRTRGMWPELAAVLERKLERVRTDGERVPLLFELAEIRATRLQLSEQAVQGFLTVLAIEPMHRPTVEALENLRQADPSTSLGVMRGLLPYYRKAGDLPREAEAMEVIVTAEQDPQARRELLEHLAVTYEKMPARREDALRIRDQLFRGHPEQWQGRQTLQRLGAELGRMNEVAAAYEAVLLELGQEAQAAETEGRILPRERALLRRDLLLEHAAMLRDALRRPQDAERAYREVLSTDETHQGAYEALEALLRARHASEELVALYRRRVDVTFNPGEQRQLLGRIIEISRHVLDDRATAIATAEELLDLIPDDLTTISMLAEMYAEGTGPDDRAKLEETLGRQAELTGDRQAARGLRVQQASLRMQYLGDAFGAVDLLGQVLGEDPDHVHARQLLEALLGVSDVQLQACAVLDPIYTRIGDHEGRIRVLQVRREHAAQSGSTDEAVGYLLQIAAVQERELGRLDAAFASVREAFLMDPTRLDTREEVERLGLALSRAEELAEVWRTALRHPQVRDVSLRIDLTTRLARLLDDALADQEGARQAWAALLDLDPPDARVAREAVEALCRLHLEAGDEVALIEAKRRLLRFTDGVAEQVRIRLEIAAIQEELRDRVSAALTYSEVLDMQPANVAALDALERLFLEEQEWARLVEVLEHRVAVTAEPRAKAAIWRSIGELHRDRLQTPERAIDAFQSVLDLKVGHDDTVYALMALVALHEKLERWPDVEEGLRRLTQLAEADEHRVELLTRTARVVGRKLGRTQDALDLLQRVLQLAPKDTRARNEVAGYLDHEDARDRAIAILTPIYEAEQNWPALLELEELQARKLPSGRRRLQALLKVAKTQEERIGDSNQAFGVLCEAMAEAADQPELEQVLGKVERLGQQAERAEALLSAYANTVDRILDSRLQQRVLRSQGRVALETLGRLDVARSAYERVLDLSPDDGAAADALEQIYLRQDAYEPLAELLVNRADRAGDPGLRDDFLIRAAEYHRRNLNQAEEAIRLYERLSAEGLERSEVQAVIEPLYEATGRWRELASHLNRKLARQEGHDAVQTHLRLGRLYGQELEDPETGIRHLSAALKLDPGQAVANEELGRYLEDPSMRLRVAQMLEPVFTSVGDWHRLIQIQEIRLAEADDEADRGKLLLRIAQIEEEQLEDLERAMSSYERLFREQPKSRRVRDQLARLCGVLGETERFANLLTEYVTTEAEADDTDEVLQVVREAAELWSGVLRQPARAVPLWQRLLLAQPDDPGIFVALESALTQAEMWPALAEAYWREADAALSEERQIDLLRRLAMVATELLEDPSEAARAYQRMLDIRPDFELARGRLEQIYAETDRHADLLELLRDRMARTENLETRAEVALRIAGIQDEQLEDSQGAVDTLEAVLGEQPDHPRAVAALEHLAQRRRPLRPRVVALLRPIYERLGNLQRLIEVDEWQLNQTADPATRQALFRQIAALQARLSDGYEASLRTLCRAVAEPGPADALEALDLELDAIARRLGAREALSDALVKAAAAEALQTDEDRRLALLVRAAALKIELDDAAGAADVLREGLALREDDPGALALLDQALGRLGHHDGLAEVLARRAEVADDDQERIELLRRLALLLDEVLARPQDAQRAWTRLLEVEPSDREALQRLSVAYERSGSTEELVAVLERRIEASLDEGERRDLRMHLASLQRETLKDRAAEIETLRAVLTEVPADEDALSALGRALQAEGRFAEAADVIAERATLAQGDERKATLLLEAARLFAGPLQDVPSALERYEQVLTLQPGHEKALADLVALAQRADSFEPAAILAVPHLQTVGRHEELATIYAARAELSPEPGEVTEALRQLAAIRLERLDDPDGALQAYVALLGVVDEEALPEVLDAAGRLAVQQGRTAEHVDFLAGRAASAEAAGSARVTLGLHAANLAERELDQPERALAVLLPLLGAELATLPLCQQIERLGRTVGDLDAVERALREASRLTPDASVQSQILVRLGLVHLDRGQLDPALESFREAFELSRDPQAVRGLEAVLEQSGHQPSAALLDALEAAYQVTGHKAGLAHVTEVRLALSPELERPRLLEQLGALREEGGGTPEEALEAWGELLRLDPDAFTAVERLLAVGRTSPARLRRATELMREAVELANERGNPATALGMQTAGVLLRELGDPEAASALVRRVLLEQPEHFDALQIEVAAARELGDPARLHNALVRSASIQSSPEQAVAQWAEAASVAELELQAPDRAVEDLEALLAVDEAQPQAWQKLLALLRSQERYDRLADALGRRANITDDLHERRELRYRLANLLVDKLGRPEDAVLAYQDMLADQPDDRDALRELEVLLRRLERWEDVRDVLERKLEVGPAHQRVDVLLELANLAEQRLSDPVDAVDRYQQVLLEDPGHPVAEPALERLFVGDEKWIELSELYETRARRLREDGDIEGYRAAISELAELLAERLENPRRADELLDELLEHDPNFVPALLAKAAVYEAIGEGDQARDALERAAMLDPQGPEGAALHLRLARVAETDVDRRRGHLERALELDPSHGGAAQELLEMYREQEDWNRVAYMLELVAARTDDHERRRDLALERVDITLGVLGDPEGALRILEPLYVAVQDDVEINRRIADGLFEAGRYDEARGMYNWLVHVGRQVKRNKMLAHYLTRMARIAMLHQDSSGAKEHLLEAYRIDTTNVETLLTLGELHEHHGEWRDALKIYRTMLLQNADQSGLLRRGDIYLALARSHLALDERPKARAMLRRGLEEDADHPRLGEQLAALEDGA